MHSRVIHLRVHFKSFQLYFDTSSDEVSNSNVEFRLGEWKRSKSAWCVFECTCQSPCCHTFPMFVRNLWPIPNKPIRPNQCSARKMFHSWLFSSLGFSFGYPLRRQPHWHHSWPFRMISHKYGSLRMILCKLQTVSKRLLSATLATFK